MRVPPRDALHKRELYATQPKEGVPSLDPRQLFRLEKEAYGTVMGTARWRRNIMEDLEQMGCQQPRFGACCFLLKNVPRRPVPQGRRQLQDERLQAYETAQGGGELQDEPPLGLLE